jgi:hypothetical protein
VAGRIAFDGTINAGTGFTVTQPATGEYDITFAAGTFSGIVNMQVTAISSAADAYTALAGAVVKVFIIDPVNASPINNSFQFLATQD